LVKLSEKFDNRGGLEYIIDFMKQSGLFWEINTDSAHDVFLDIVHPGKNGEKTEALLHSIIKNRIHVSVGSDTHSLVQYDYGRLRRANEVAKLLNKVSYG